MNTYLIDLNLTKIKKKKKKKKNFLKKKKKKKKKNLQSLILSFFNFENKELAVIIIQSPLCATFLKFKKKIENRNKKFFS